MKLTATVFCARVSEGINATYSPYFIPAAMDIYFLENFHDLPTALQKSKHTVLFAIPRLYEKIWEQLSANRFGQQYLRTENSVKKRWCARKDLLQNFRDLGIEIHNAYGLSEAPLVAMNRLGSNDIETVGPPLLNARA